MGEQHSTSKNPIDPDKVTGKPGLLPYAHHVGSAIIRPTDQGRVKGIAMQAMYQQTDTQLQQIKNQVELLLKQAQEIHDRITLSEEIYNAECGFKPVSGNQYYLFKKNSGSHLISIIGPEEWGKNKPYEYVATIFLLADHTWQILDKAE
jgi:hypothetical protein